MFTGLVEEIGTVRSVQRGDQYRVLHIEARRVLDDAGVGDSIAIDGACQTITTIERDTFTVETLAASVQKTTLGSFRAGRRVNLERSLTPQQRMGGHFVQGHVDGTARVVDIRTVGHNVYFSVELPSELARYCIRGGSIAIDGTSLTIAEFDHTTIVVNVIPTTWRATALADREPGDAVNIEVDVLARYVARLLDHDTTPDERAPAGTGAPTCKHERR